MLARTDQLKADDLKRCQAAFDALDADGSGTLDMANLNHDPNPTPNHTRNRSRNRTENEIEPEAEREPEPEPEPGTLDMADIEEHARRAERGHM